MPDQQPSPPTLTPGALRPRAGRCSRLVAALALVTAVGCGDRPAAPGSDTAPSAAPAAQTAAPQTLRLQLNWFPEPEFGGIYAARERGFFAAQGLEVELLQGGADVPAPQLLAAGKVELAVLAAEQVLTLRAAGGPVRAIYAAFQRAPRVIIVKADAPAASLAELWQSKATILAQDGMSFIRFLNQKYGGKELSFVPYSGSAAPLLAGSVDAMQGFATAEPVQLALDGHAVRSFRVGDEGFDPYDVVIAVNEGFLASHPETVAKVVTALRAGWRSYLDDPGPINEVMASLNRDMNLAVMNESAKRLPAFVESPDTAAHGLGWMTAERWQALADQLTALGDLTPPVDPATAWLNPVAAE
jgi:NitT/TauT family transport system substrate-binding protein